MPPKGAKPSTQSVEVASSDGVAVEEDGEHHTTGYLFLEDTVLCQIWDAYRANGAYGHGSEAPDGASKLKVHGPGAAIITAKDAGTISTCMLLFKHLFFAAHGVPLTTNALSPKSAEIWRGLQTALVKHYVNNGAPETQLIPDTMRIPPNQVITIMNLIRGWYNDLRKSRGSADESIRAMARDTFIVCEQHLQMARSIIATLADETGVNIVQAPQNKLLKSTAVVEDLLRVTQVSAAFMAVFDVTTEQIAAVNLCD
jgi:hypothetical protein